MSKGPDRAWTLLSRCYEEVTDAGRWLLRHEPAVDSLFPLLHVAGRSRPPRNKPQSPEPTPAEEPGTATD